MAAQQPNEEHIFNLARRISGADARSEYLRQVCGDDRQLRARIEALLTAHEESGFMAAAPADARTIDQPVSEGRGSTIGKYKLLQRIGEGGFGVVFMAEQQDPVRRTVALKIVKPGMDTRDVVARFEAERQALAMMNHPNIAHIFDGGVTESGRPYFAMELVKGVAITDYCDKNTLATEDRLRMFVDVCRAVQHAHQKGVIHRDLKPANVLVTLHDGKPAPKVIDFGVSKAINQRLTERTLFTTYGQMVGTPQYMSPEQAEMSGLDVDTRSDIYSLGVLLYELLTGSTPLQAERLRAVAYVEMQRIILEEDPPRPSIRLSTAGEELTVIARHRSVDPKHLSQLVRGELDWIVMRSLEKDRSRRYETSSDLANDVQRFLAGDTVEACPPSVWYRWRKSARRHKAALATAAIVGICLLCGIAVTSWLAHRAIQAEIATAEEKERTEEERDRAIAAERKQRKLSEERNAALTAQTVLTKQAEAEAELRRRLLYIADMNVVQQSWQVNNVDRMIELLERHKPESEEKDLRGFEWHYYWGLCRKSINTPRIQLSGCGTAIAFAPDGKTIAVGEAGVNEEGLVEVFAIDDRQLVQRCGPRNDYIHDVAFSPDGKLIAIPCEDGRVILRDVETEEDEILPVQDKMSIRAVAFSPDGRFLATGGESRFVHVWDLVAREITKELAHGGETYSVAFSPDGVRLATGSTDGKLTVWNLEAGEELWVADAFRGVNAGKVLFSPDSSTVVCATEDDQIQVLNSQTGEARVFGGHDHEIRGFAFSPRSNILATGGRDNAVKLWDLTTGALLETLTGHSGFVQSIAFSPDGDTLASASRDYTVRLWDVSQPPTTTLLARNDGVREIGFSRRHPGKLFSLDGDGEVVSWDLRTGESTLISLDSSGAFVAMQVSPEGLLATASEDGLQLWDLETKEDLGKLSDRPLANLDIGSLRLGVFSPSGEYLAVAIEGNVEIYSVSDRRLMHVISSNLEGIRSISFSGDSKMIAAGGFRTVRLWDVKTGHLLRESTDHRDWIQSLAFSPDDATLATGAFDNKICLWDLETDHSRRLKGHTGPIHGLLFSQDGHTLISGGGEGVVRIWDVETGQQKSILPDPDGGIFGLVWSQDECVVAGRTARPENGRIRVWRTAE